ncbi:MAG: hypothetical protein AUI14_06280 [Actinobacteria bacterium 13_2_20CM_2_71_6]|nr:MAG: hypothetical protein AUI14_06280 [Actinobacteria bacterium 13_2_20CM_2_71_6]
MPVGAEPDADGRGVGPIAAPSAVTPPQHKHRDTTSPMVLADTICCFFDSPAQKRASPTMRLQLERHSSLQ